MFSFGGCPLFGGARAVLCAAHVVGHPVVQFGRILRVWVLLDQCCLVAYEVWPDLVGEELDLPQPEKAVRNMSLDKGEPGDARARLGRLADTLFDLVEPSLSERVADAASHPAPFVSERFSDLDQNQARMSGLGLGATGTHRSDKVTPGCLGGAAILESLAEVAGSVQRPAGAGGSAEELDEPRDLLLAVVVSGCT